MVDSLRNWRLLNKRELNQSLFMESWDRQANFLDIYCSQAYIVRKRLVEPSLEYLTSPREKTQRNWHRFSLRRQVNQCDVVLKKTVKKNLTSVSSSLISCEVSLLAKSTWQGLCLIDQPPKKEENEERRSSLGGANGRHLLQRA